MIGLFALLAASVAACGDDSSTSATPGTSGQTSGSPSSSGPGSSASPAGTKSGTAQITGSGADALKKLANDLSGKTYQVTYQLNMTPKTGTPTAGTMTMSQKPPKSATSIDMGAQGKFLIIDDGKFSFTCTSDPSSGPQCIKQKSTGGPNPLAAGFSLGSILKNVTDSVNVTSAGSRTIGGIESQCFVVKEADAPDGTACFSKDGILTLVESTSADGSKTVLQASKGSTSVPDSAFAPPDEYKVVDATGGN